MAVSMAGVCWYVVRLFCRVDGSNAWFKPDNDMEGTQPRVGRWTVLYIYTPREGSEDLSVAIGRLRDMKEIKR